MSDHSRPAGTGPMAAAKSPAGLADAVRDQATGYVERRKSEAAGFLADLARSLRGGTGGSVEGTQVKTFMHTVADGLDDLSRHIDRRGPGELYRDVEVVARRNPMATAALAAAAGYGAFHVLRYEGSRP